MCQLICKHVSWFLGTENKNDCTKVWFWFSTVRKYVHVFIFFKKLGIPFCTAPVPVVCQFICPVNTIMKSFEIYLTKNLHFYKCTYVFNSLRMLFFLFLFLKFQLPYRNQFLMCVRMYVCMIRMYINVFIAKI